MTKQIAVRLPEDLVEFVDEQVASGQAASRASAIAKALDRERRRSVAAQDVVILVADGDDPDMDRLAAYLVAAPLDVE